MLTPDISPSTGRLVEGGSVSVLSVRVQRTTANTSRARCLEFSVSNWRENRDSLSAQGVKSIQQEVKEKKPPVLFHTFHPSPLKCSKHLTQRPFLVLIPLMFAFTKKSPIYRPVAIRSRSGHLPRRTPNGSFFSVPRQDLVRLCTPPVFEFLCFCCIVFETLWKRLHTKMIQVLNAPTHAMKH